MTLLKRKNEKGNIMMIALLGMLVMMMVGMVAVDNGLQYTLRQDIRSTAEAAALGGAQRLDESASIARLDAVRFALYNNFQGDILIGAFINPDLMTKSISQYSDTEVVNLVYASLVVDETDTFSYDNFARVPITAFSSAQLKSVLGDLETNLGNPSAGSPWTRYSDTVALTAYRDANHAMSLTIVTPLPDAKAQQRGIGAQGSIGILIEEGMVNHFAKYFDQYVSEVSAFSVGVNNNTSEIIQLNWDLSANGHIHASPFLHNNYIYVCEAQPISYNNGRVICVRTDSGVPVWAFETATGVLRRYDQTVTPPGASTDMNWWDANATSFIDNSSYTHFGKGGGTHNVQTTVTSAKGNVYAVSTNGYAYCIDATTGVPQWMYHLGDGQISNIWTNASPVAYNDWLFMGNSGDNAAGHYNDVVAVPLEYTPDATGVMPEAAAVVYDMSVGGTIGGSSGQIGTTPAIIDVHPTWTVTSGGIVPDACEALMVVGSTNNYLYCLGVDISGDSPSFQNVWYWNCGEDVTGNPRYYDGAIYIGDDGDDMMKFLVNPGANDKDVSGNFLMVGGAGSSNRPRWIFDTTNLEREFNPGNYGRHSTSYKNYHNGVLVTVQSGQKILYFGDGYGYAYALNDPDQITSSSNNLGVAPSPVLIWDVKPDEHTVRVEATPAYRRINDRGYVFFGARTTTNGFGGTGGEGGTGESGTKGGYFFSLDAANGEVHTLYPIADDTHGSMLVDGDRLYYSGCDEKVYSYQFAETVTSEEAYLIR